MININAKFDINDFMHKSIAGYAFSIIISILCIVVLTTEEFSLIVKMLAVGITTLEIGISIAKGSFGKNPEKYMTNKYIIPVIYASMIENILMMGFVGFSGLDVGSFIICFILMGFVYIKSKYLDNLEKN